MALTLLPNKEKFMSLKPFSYINGITFRLRKLKKEQDKNLQ